MKNKHNISFRLVSYTDAAGKYSPEALRNGNEDNFYVNDNLADCTTSQVAQDEVIQLGEFGMLMVVADGMGGMNAGEVASQIAVDSVKDAFALTSLTASVLATSQSRQKYLEQSIKQADKKIKLAAQEDSHCEGMGSTIIAAWLFKDELTISWCGDSRAYIFNEKSGIRLISKDHSYVQELVNKGLLTYNQTFDHPQNNIITRSLGDPTKDARPESKVLKVGKGDIILLCSDGLSGVLRDRKTYDDKGLPYPEDNIEDIIRSHTSSMKECREALWAASEKGGWYDNVTAILCQITDGPESVWSACPTSSDAGNGNNSKRYGVYAGICALIIAAIVAAFFVGKGCNKQTVNKHDDAAVKETICTPAIKDSTSTAPSAVREKESVPVLSGKPSVQEQIKKQAKEKADTASRSAGLTKIEKGRKESGPDAKGNGKLTPIEDKPKKDISDNPLAPSNHKKDNISNNPLKNQ